MNIAIIVMDSGTFPRGIIFYLWPPFFCTTDSKKKNKKKNHADGFLLRGPLLQTENNQYLLRTFFAVACEDQGAWEGD